VTGVTRFLNSSGPNLKDGERGPSTRGGAPAGWQTETRI